jgi:hypothetical protein
MRPLLATRVLASGVFTGKQQHLTSAITPGAPAQIYERQEYLFRVFVICLRAATMCGKFRARKNLLLTERLDIRWPVGDGAACFTTNMAPPGEE